MKWICEHCDSVSDDEHAPCSCDGDRDDLLDEIRRLRAECLRRETVVIAAQRYYDVCANPIADSADRGMACDALFAALTRKAGT